MEVKDLPQPIRDAVQHFLEKNPQLADSDEAAGLCLEASADFLVVLEKFGIPIGPNWQHCLREYIFVPKDEEECLRQRFDDHLHSFPFDSDGCRFHFVVKLGELIIDFTARQFGVDNPFPAIWIER